MHAKRRAAWRSAKTGAMPLPSLSLYLQRGDVGGEEEEARLEHNGPLGLSPPLLPSSGGAARHQGDADS